LWVSSLYDKGQTQIKARFLWWKHQALLAKAEGLGQSVGETVLEIAEGVTVKAMRRMV
jgi:hypothetical protein